MQTRTKLPKALLFFYFIPYLAILFLTALDCVLNFAYLTEFWIKEWMVALPETLAVYLLTAMIYGSFGMVCYFIFFGKRWEKWTMALLSLVLAFLLPFSRYVVRHIGYGQTLTNLDMLDLYNEDVTFGVTMLIYAALALLVILLERAYYAWILRTEPRNEAKIYSPKHPVGLSMMIFFGAMIALATLNFIMNGDFGGAAFLSIGLEYVIDIAGFWIACFTAYMLRKWYATSKTA